MPRVLPEYRSRATSKIIDAARALFRERGYRQTTMDGIASKLGISKAALYTYFKDKEELFKAAYESSPRDLEKVIESVVHQGDTKTAFEAFFDRMMPSSKESVGLSFEVISEATRNLELRGVLKKHYDQYLDAVERCIVQTSRQKRTNTRELAGSVLALWDGMESLVALGFPIAEVRVFWNGAMEKLLAQKGRAASSEKA